MSSGVRTAFDDNPDIIDQGESISSIALVCSLLFAAPCMYVTDTMTDGPATS
ncbi:hypothetical protein GY45DRAFT_1319006 [Cubamyces sp. BRFM 1775]|nr:hypothetical protein GY45DRAFT_1319006 [Cubamyces sp. BRFM 1775]